jgi:hypothetical protein
MIGAGEMSSEKLRLSRAEPINQRRVGAEKK